MNVQPPFQMVPLGDAALLLQWDNCIEADINKQVLYCFEQLKSANLPFLKDVIPAYSSLAVYYDVAFIHRHYRVDTAFHFVTGQLQQTLLKELPAAVQTAPRRVQIPVCYQPLYALDIAAVAVEKRLTIDDVIHIHTSTLYTVYMIGFLPGFAYMGKVDDRIAVPRKREPRLHVERGSVGIAGAQTGIYPLASPGGWQIIGRTPLLLFNKEAQNPVALQPGDEVQFFSITEDEFRNY